MREKADGATARLFPQATEDLSPSEVCLFLYDAWKRVWVPLEVAKTAERHVPVYSLDVIVMNSRPISYVVTIDVQQSGGDLDSLYWFELEI